MAKTQDGTYKPKIIVWESQSNISGGQRVALNIAGHLKDKFDFRFIVPSAGQLSAELKNMGICVYYIPVGNYRRGKKGVADILKYLFFTPSALLKSYGIAKNADLIYANSTKLFVWSTIIGALTNTPVLWHLHNLLTDTKSKYLLKIFANFSSVRKIIAVSHAAKNHSGCNGEKCEVVYNGVDVSRFKPGRKKADSDVKNVGIIADILPQKGHETLIKAIGKIKGSLPVKLIIVGAPAAPNGSYFNKLKHLVSGLHLDGDVEFTGHRTDIPEIMNSLDMLVIPSSSFEACPMAALEALACGVPVIGSNLGGTPEIIGEGKTGHIFKAGDENDLAEKILSVLSGDDSYKTMCADCRKSAEDNFDLRVCSEKIEIVLNDLLRIQG